MDRRSWFTLLAISLVPTLSGCGDSSGQAPAKAAPAAMSAVAATPQKAAAATPEKAVHCFLEAVRKGDDAAAGQMLTDLARKKTQEINMVVAPPGSDTARFNVGTTEMVEDGKAYVASDWTDLDSEGKLRTDKIVWIVRRDGQQQWRIAGMAAKVFPDRPPVQLNFEDPQEMLKQQQMIEREATAQMRQEQRQATKPQDPFQTGPK